MSRGRNERQRITNHQDDSCRVHIGINKKTAAQAVFLFIESKLLCFRAYVEVADMFCRPHRRQNSRGGVESAYLELERSDEL